MDNNQNENKYSEEQIKHAQDSVQGIGTILSLVFLLAILGGVGYIIYDQKVNNTTYVWDIFNLFGKGDTDTKTTASSKKTTDDDKKEEEEITVIDYEILEPGSFYEDKSIGYYLEESKSNDKYSYYYIYDGPVNNPSIYLNITNVSMDKNKNVTVTVEKVSTEKEDVIQVITYPYAVIKITTDINSITIFDADDEELEFIDKIGIE